jgi:hypothetical protein
MGTRGYYVFLFNGVYYVYYNQFDSYPSGLGLQIVEELSEINNIVIDNWKTQLEKIETNPYPPNCLSFEGLSKAINNYFQYDVQVMKTKPEQNLWIEWIYTIDLDNNTFKVNDELPYSLSNLELIKQHLIALEECDN